MGGPGSGGFRGYGWPPGSLPCPVSQLSAYSMPQMQQRRPKASNASRQKKYRKHRDPKSTARDKALQEARRLSSVRRSNVRMFKAPIKWKKFKKTSKIKTVITLHHSLPLWLRGKIKEFTTCKDSLVLLKVEKEPYLRCDDVKPRKGWPQKVKPLIAVPLGNLWTIKE